VAAVAVQARGAREDAGIMHLHAHPAPFGAALRNSTSTQQIESSHSKTHSTALQDILSKLFLLDAAIMPVAELADTLKLGS
jgi:hypothetical protein